MRTLDGASVAKQAIERLYSKYPEGSLSPREVVMSVPMDYDEQQIQHLNSVITHALYKNADEFIKSLPPKQKSGFSIIPKDLSYTDKRAEAEAFKQKLTQTVVDAVHSAVSVKK